MNSTEKETHPRASNRPSEAELLNALLSKYIDLLNAHGPASAQARAFLAEHADNKQLLKLAASAREVQGLFAEGCLDSGKPPNG